MVTPINRTSAHLLRQLAHSYGVQTAYYDVTHRRRQASPEALLCVLRAMGASVETLADVPNALRDRQQALWKRRVEPVVVAWDGGPAELEVRLPERQSARGGSIALQLKLETGETQDRAYALGHFPISQAAEVEGTGYVAKRLILPGGLPWGYHQLTMETSEGVSETLVISAPSKAYPAEEGPKRKMWGAFLPLYSLPSQKGWGCGDLSDLRALMDWLAGLGGSLVATLPFLACFLDKPFDPSPYASVSRLFWNEFYVDVEQAIVTNKSPGTQALLESAETQGELEALRLSPLVDYHRQMALKRKILEKLAHDFFGERPSEYAAFRRFVEENPRVDDYARFRATGERRGELWPTWPQPLRDGALKPGDYLEEAKDYHRYVQWLAHEQLQAISERARQKGQGLYLDLPLGVHPDGYDVWRERDAFVLDVAAGAPPDAFFSKGQNWGFPPFHPQIMREQGYQYLIACLRHQLRHAGVLRVDHVMGLHRLYWVPKGMDAQAGAYVRYPAEELYAILSLESHRHQAIIVGEDLGTVPRYVRTAMRRHNVHRLYVVPFKLTSGPSQALPAVPSYYVASLNTHDMPTFAAFWRGLDIEDRIGMGLLDEWGARNEWENRQARKRALTSFLQGKGWLKDDPGDEQAVLQACLALLSASPAKVVLVNLEDLWLETQPQNVPGTWQERPNWRRKARYSLEEFCQMPQVVETLKEIDHLRKRGRSTP